jgi:hypothetical protein
VSVQFDPSGQLDVASDPGDLPEVAQGSNIASGALTRCKNLRLNQRGQAKTRDGSAKVNASAIDTDIWHIAVQGGVRYVFAGDRIYRNETSIASGLTEAAWSSVQYSAFNDLTLQVYAMNGTNRKRIEGSTVYEWGIAAPTEPPILAVGAGVGLTGEYNAVYTYARKVGSALVAESNPSPPSANTAVLNNQSLSVDVTQPSDSQVTHIRVYRTQANLEIYYLEREIAIGNGYTYGYTYDWELSDAYLDEDEGFSFTVEDETHTTRNTYTWESVFLTHDTDDTSGSGSSDSGSVQDDTTWQEVPWWNIYYPQ